MDKAFGINGGDAVEGCQPCLQKNKTVAASLYCKQCRQYQCSNCSACHTFIPVLSGHEVVSVKNASPEKKVDLKNMDKCSDHNEDVRFLCEDHDLLCCKSCAILEHRQCGKVSDIKKVANSSSENFDDIKNRLVEIQQKAEALLKHYGDVRSSTENGIVHIYDRFNTMSEKVSHILKTSKDELEKKKSEIFGKVEDSRRKTDEAKKSTQETLRVLGNVKRNSTSVEK